MEKHSNDALEVLVERCAEKKWYLYVLDASKYSVRLNTMWINEMTANVIALGFFPMDFVFTRISNIGTLSQENISKGFARVQYLLKRRKHHLSRTVQMEQCIHASGVKGLMIDPEVLFHDKFGSDTLSKWIKLKLPPQKLIVRGPFSREKSHTTSSIVGGDTIMVNEDSRRIEEAGDSRTAKAKNSKAMEAEDSRMTVEAEDSRMTMEAEDSRMTMEAEDSRMTMEAEDSRRTVEVEGLRRIIEVDDSRMTMEDDEDSRRIVEAEVSSGPNRKSNAPDFQSRSKGYSTKPLTKKSSPKKSNNEVSSTPMVGTTKDVQSNSQRGGKRALRIPKTIVPQKRQKVSAQTSQVGRKQKTKDVADEGTQLIESGNETKLIIRNMDDRMDVDLPEAKEIEKSHKVLQEVKEYYPFGMKMHFQIPVVDITPPPATMCYRKINSSHVDEIMTGLIMHPGQQPHPAHLVPYNPQTLLPLNFKSGDLQSFKKLMPKIKFFAISGQHSALAAKQICEHAKKNPDLQELA
ncbi:unnamed protein product [Calypogeia fissa]